MLTCYCRYAAITVQVLDNGRGFYIHCNLIIARRLTWSASTRECTVKLCVSDNIFIKNACRSYTCHNTSRAIARAIATTYTKYVFLRQIFLELVGTFFAGVILMFNSF